jgi:hypothetical protein
MPGKASVPQFITPMELHKDSSTRSDEYKTPSRKNVFGMRMSGSNNNFAFPNAANRTASVQDDSLTVP